MASAAPILRRARDRRCCAARTFRANNDVARQKFNGVIELEKPALDPNNRSGERS
jgi:hypothetical protein